jgi:hypothetical protein
MAGHQSPMTITARYPHHERSGAPYPIAMEAIWAVAIQARRQMLLGDDSLLLSAATIAAAADSVVANGRAFRVAWDLGHAVHDAQGRPVLGVCQTDPDLPYTALVSVNGPMVKGRADLAASTAAHELGHVLFDVPAALGEAGCCFRAVTSEASMLFGRAGAHSERRANEFMGALLAPPVTLHRRLVHHAHGEGLRMVTGAHRGRQGFRILGANNPEDAVAGVVAALASEFGVSETFVRVRLRRYLLVEGGAP